MLAAAACAGESIPPAVPAPSAVVVVTEAEGGPLFFDVTEAAGLVFRHHEDLTEMQPVGAGVLVLDYNGDGLHDAYLTDSLGPNALFRNNGDGTFTDVAWQAGVADEDGHSNGGCAADYDNDSDQDLYVTNHGPSRLFRNEGDGTFTDVSGTQRSGRSCPIAQVDRLRMGRLRQGRPLGSGGGAPFPRADLQHAGGGNVP